jgi:uracil-DNA glycosylase
MKDWEQLNAAVIACKNTPASPLTANKLPSKRSGNLATKPHWSKPITGFGDRNARLVLIGLAPAAHGGNRTGRIFTGNSSAQTQNGSG